MTDTTPDDRSPNGEPVPVSGLLWPRTCLVFGVIFTAIGFYTEYESTGARSNSALLIGISQLAIAASNFKRIQNERVVAAKDEEIRRHRNDLARLAAATK